MNRRAATAGLAWAAVSAAHHAAAQPRRGDRATPTVADRGSAVYAFDRSFVRTEEGRGSYQLTIARPIAPPVGGGYPVLYALDGNLALAALDEQLLERLAGGDAPVMVAIAHDGDDAIDPARRAFDYTPLPAGAEPGSVTDHAGRPGGGADRFLELIDRVVRPQVENGLAIDPAREVLWGHSYGGLFALHAAFTRPHLFSRYVAASPSLWWNYGSILTETAAFLAGSRPAGLKLDIMVGEQEIQPRDPSAPARHPMWASLEPGEAGRLAQRLSLAGVDVDYLVLPGMGHGETLGASLRISLSRLAGVEERPS